MTPAARAAFIRANLPVLAPACLPEIRLHLAGPASGLGRLLRATGAQGAPPYWAYVWGGGAALARHLLDHPELAAAKRVLDLGAGGGAVAIAAARCGAKQVLAAEIDPNGAAALALNAALNGVELTVVPDDLTLGPAPEADLVLVGDLFYAPDLALKVGAFLDRCIAAGVEVLVGDPWRASLPRARLQLLAELSVPDFGDGAPARAAVFRWVGS